MSLLGDAARLLLSAAGQGLVTASSIFDTDVRVPSGTPPHYTAAGQGPRFNGLSSSRLSVNTILAGTADTLRARSHAMHREDAFTRKGIRALKSHAVGTGICVQSQIKDQKLREMVHEAWSDFWEECDADGRTDFGGLTALAVQSMALSGEVFGRLRFRRASDGYRVPLQIQILEADLCPHELTRIESDGSIVRQGIQTNGIGERTFYWLFPIHPGDLNIPGVTMQAQPIRAREMLHVFESVRPGQLRGEPWLASVITVANDLNTFDDATLQKADLAAAITGFIRPGPPDPTKTSLSKNDEPDANGSVDQTVTVGSLRVLQPEEQVEFAPAADVGNTYEPFVKHNLRRQAAGIGVPYHSCTGDLSEANYTASRVGRLDFKAFCDQLLYHVIVPQWCKPIYEAWFQRAVLSGAFGDLLTAEAFNKSPRDYLRARWVAPKWDWVDPQKEVEATKIKIRCGLTSRAAEVRALGDDVEIIDAEIAQDNERADHLDLVLDSDPRRTLPTGKLEQPVSEVQPVEEPLTPPGTSSTKPPDTSSTKPAPPRRAPPLKGVAS